VYEPCLRPAEHIASELSERERPSNFGLLDYFRIQILYDQNYDEKDLLYYALAVGRNTFVWPAAIVVQVLIAEASSPSSWQGIWQGGS